MLKVRANPKYKRPVRNVAHQTNLAISKNLAASAPARTATLPGALQGRSAGLINFQDMIDHHIGRIAHSSMWEISGAVATSPCGAISLCTRRIVNRSRVEGAVVGE
jgi:hypothetical protein